MNKEIVERILAKVVGTEMSAQELETVSGGRYFECFEWCAQGYGSTTHSLVCDWHD